MGGRGASCQRAAALPLRTVSAVLAKFQQGALGRGFCSAFRGALVAFFINSAKIYIRISRAFRQTDTAKDGKEGTECWPSEGWTPRRAATARHGPCASRTSGMRGAPRDHPLGPVSVHGHARTRQGVVHHARVLRHAVVPGLRRRQADAQPIRMWLRQTLHHGNKGKGDSLRRLAETRVQPSRKPN